MPSFVVSETMCRMAAAFSAHSLGGTCKIWSAAVFDAKSEAIGLVKILAERGLHELKNISFLHTHAHHTSHFGGPGAGGRPTGFFPRGGPARGGGGGSPAVAASKRRECSFISSQPAQPGSGAPWWRWSKHRSTPARDARRSQSADSPAAAGT